MTAVTTSSGGPYDLFNAVNLLYGSGSYTRNEELDSLFVDNDDKMVLNSTGKANVYVIGGTAMNANKLGIYINDLGVKSKPLAQYGEIFDWTGNGTQENPFMGVNFSYRGGAAISWYVDSTDWKTAALATFFSGPQLNVDGYDHTVTYSLSGLKNKSIWIKNNNITQQHNFSENAYLIGFEDRGFGDYGGLTGRLGDDDYNDLIILVDATEMNPSTSAPLLAASAAAPAAVPEPATITLVATGLAGLFMYGRRKRLP
jgi:hypothetical protein